VQSAFALDTGLNIGQTITGTDLQGNPLSVTDRFVKGASGVLGVLGLPGTATTPKNTSGIADEPANLGAKAGDPVQPPKDAGDVKLSGDLGETNVPGRVFREDGSAIPFGFNNIDEYNSFANTLKSNLPKETEALFQGSSVTGRNSETGDVFDVGRLSDYDIALAGDSLFQQAKSLGYKAKDGSRIGPLNEQQLEKLGLLPVAEKLSEKAGRPVKFMLFDSTGSAYKRPSIIVF
jgi:hypothetical protein